MGRLARFIRFFTDEDDGEPVPPPVWDSVTGNPVSFNAITPFPLKQLQIAFSPVQDLHGYDSPWPAGGGKNKLSIDPSIVTKTQKGVTFTVNRNSAGDVTSIVANGTAESRTYFDLGHYNISGGTILNGCPAGGGTQAYGLAIDGTAVADYGSGSTIESDLPNAWLLIVIAKDYVCNNLTFKPMVRLSSVSDASFAPYSNICPISGWDGVTVEQRGKNLLALPVSYFTIDATIANCFFIKAGTYTLSYSCDQTHRSGYRLIDLNGNVLSDNAHKPNSNYPYNASAKAYYAGINQPAGNRAATITIVEDCYIRVVSNQNATGGGFTSAQLEFGSTATAYVPYNPLSRSISISFGSTVYSGTLDVLTGVVTVTGEKHKVSDYTWLKYSGGNNTFYSNIRAKKAGNDNALTDTYAYAAVAIANMPDKSYRGYNNNGNVYVKDSAYADAAEFMAGAANVELWFELAEPIPIQLTPEQVSSLAGENVAWASTNGDLEITYRSA